MLGTIIRSIFFIVIIYWYSANVWKMIDSYFRDQFRRYLEEEYRRNPLMKADREKQNSARAAEGSVTDEPKRREMPPAQSLPETCQVDDARSDGKATFYSGKNDGNETGGSSGENAVGHEPDDKNAFLETYVESSLESRKLNDATEEETREVPSVNHGDRTRKSEVTEGIAAALHSDASSRESRPRSRRVIRASQRYELARNKRKEPKPIAITFTEEDFASVERHYPLKDDFWEFEDETEGTNRKDEVSNDGIFVKDLPFKPRVDLGRLERIAAEEFCPLTPEDEASRGEIAGWP